MYAWAYALDYVGPLLGLAAIWVVLWLILRFARRWLPWPGVVALLVVLGVAAVPIWQERRDREADVAYMARYEVTALPTDLPPGRVLWLESDVAPCGYLCPELTLAPWAASVTRDEDALTSGDFVVFDGVYVQDIVWPRLERAAPLPYDYLLLSASVFRLPGLSEDGPPPDWPESVQSVILLVQLSEDGWVDLATQDVLYQRFVHLHRVSQYPFWPRIKTNTDTPRVAEIIAQLIGPTPD